MFFLTIFRGILFEKSAIITQSLLPAGVQIRRAAFDPADTKLAGHGIRTMRSRVQRLHADLALESAPSTGAKIRLRLPIAT